MKKTFLFFLIALCSNLSFAQKDVKSQEILKGVSAKYKSLKSLSATFKIAIADQKQNSTQNQTGNITLFGDKYNLLLTGQQIISDGKSVWTYLKDANEVQVSDASSKTEGISPSTLFTIYENGFDSRFVEEKTNAGKTIQIIDLTPMDKKKPYFKIQLHVDKKEKSISTAKIFNNNGTQLNYSITKLTPNAAVNDAMFSFDPKKFPGVEVVDLR